MPAAEKGHDTCIVELLLSEKADVTLQDKYGITAPKHGMEWHVRVVEMLPKVDATHVMM